MNNDIATIIEELVHEWNYGVDGYNEEDSTLDEMLACMSWGLDDALYRMRMSVAGLN